jgi:uncharacterized damage-inducible protein DinB
MDAVRFFQDQLQREHALNKKVLEEVPEGNNSWKPHEKSMELGYLAALVAQMPAWISLVLTTDELELTDPHAGKDFRPVAQDSTQALLAYADAALDKATSALSSVKEEQWDQPWTLKIAGKPASSATRLQQVAENFTHAAHHRGQLTVYLRLLGNKVPATYGPSADEKVG